MCTWSLAYGNILQCDKPGVQQTDPDIVSAIKYTLSVVAARTPDVFGEIKFDEDGKIKNADVISVTEKRLVYSEDEEHPLESYIEFGCIIDFTLQLSAPDGTNTVHSFSVSKYMEPDPWHLYTHFFHPISMDEPKAKQQKIADTDESQITIMTYNIWNMNAVSDSQSDYVKRIQHLGKVVLDAGPDIVCFQEVRYQHNKGGQLGPNQVKHLADMLKHYQFVYIPAQLQGHSLQSGRTEEGLAIFSRFPIISQRHILLTRDRNNSSDGHQRILLHVEVMHPVIGKTNILDTHLSLSSIARKTSVTEIWKYVKDLHGPMILVGDMNAKPSEDPMRFLRGEIQLENELTQGLHDTWLVTHGDNVDGFTYDGLLAKEKRGSRIDYIYSNLENIDLMDVKIIDEGFIGEEAASDHLPVIAKFKYKS